MSTYPALTAPKRFVKADGIRFAYRRWGKPGGLPLVFFLWASDTDKPLLGGVVGGSRAPAILGGGS
jgi:hypothetical protein